MLSVESNLVNLDAFFTKPEYASTRKVTELALDWLANGREAEILAAASETLPEVREALEREMKGRWPDANAVAVLDAPESAYVFLQRAPTADFYLAFFFRKKDGRPYLRRIDFVDHRTFTAKRLAGQALPAPTDQLPENYRPPGTAAARPTAAPVAVAPAGGDVPPPLPPPPASWFLGIDGKQAGPFDLAALRVQAQKGTLTRTTLVWKKGMANWTAAGEVAEMKCIFEELPPALPGT